MADVLEEFLSGKQATAVSSAPSVITDQILNRLKMVESSGDPYALNKESKAMGAYQFMPEQVQTMHKQGIKFNPFDENESRAAAKSYLEKLVKEKGSVEKALAVYGGFVTKDPTAYVKQVLQEPTTQQAKSTQAPQAVPSDPLEAFLSGQQAPEKPVVTPPVEGGTQVGRTAAKYLQSLQEGVKQVPGFLASAADVVASAPSAVAGLVGYGAGRVFGLSDEQAKAASQKVAAPISAPIGRMTGLAETAAYKEALPSQVMDYIGEHLNEGAQFIGKKFGVSPLDVEAAINATLMGLPFAPKAVRGALKEAPKPMATMVEPSIATAEIPAVQRKGMMNEAQIAQMQAQFEAKKAGLAPEAPAAPVLPTTPVTSGLGASMGAAATPDSTTIRQALSVATPELQAALKDIPIDRVNLPTFQRHIEADSLFFPVRLTEGQATGDIVKISNEQNRRGKDPELAQRFNEQNGQLIENINEIRKRAAPDVYGTKTIENSQGIIDAYKIMDDARNVKIREAYKALEDANGGKFPVDGVALANNAELLLSKKLKTEFLPSSIKSQLDRFKSGEPMNFEQFEAMRTNLAAEIRKAERAGDGNAGMALSLVREAVEKLPLSKGTTGKLKPIADQARSLAKERFDMLKKDPAYKAAVDDTVAADNFMQKFVINGVNKNIRTMVDHLGRGSEANQHMAAGTVNWLRDKAGVIDEKSNFSQKQYNAALKKLDDVNNLQEIFNGESASQLKTLGNVANYTQFQPRGTFVNNSNTLVGALAEKAKRGIGLGVQKGIDVMVPGLQLGTSLMEMRARRAAEAETKKSLELGAGTKQTGSNNLNEFNK
jgi:hypothetical protein